MKRFKLLVLIIILPVILVFGALQFKVIDLGFVVKSLFPRENINILDIDGVYFYYDFEQSALSLELSKVIFSYIPLVKEGKVENVLCLISAGRLLSENGYRKIVPEKIDISQVSFVIDSVESAKNNHENEDGIVSNIDSVQDLFPLGESSIIIDNINVVYDEVNLDLEEVDFKISKHDDFKISLNSKGNILSPHGESNFEPSLELLNDTLDVSFKGECFNIKKLNEYLGSEILIRSFLEAKVDLNKMEVSLDRLDVSSDNLLNVTFRTETPITSNEARIQIDVGTLHPKLSKFIDINPCYLKFSEQQIKLEYDLSLKELDSLKNFPEVLKKNYLTQCSLNGSVHLLLSQSEVIVNNRFILPDVLVTNSSIKIHDFNFNEFNSQHSITVDKDYRLKGIEGFLFKLPSQLSFNFNNQIGTNYKYEVDNFNADGDFIIFQNKDGKDLSIESNGQTLDISKVSVSEKLDEVLIQNLKLKSNLIDLVIPELKLNSDSEGHAIALKCNIHGFDNLQYMDLLNRWTPFIEMYPMLNTISIKSDLNELILYAKLTGNEIDLIDAQFTSKDIYVKSEDYDDYVRVELFSLKTKDNTKFEFSIAELKNDYISLNSKGSFKIANYEFKDPSEIKINNSGNIIFGDVLNQGFFGQLLKEKSQFQFSKGDIHWALDFQLDELHGFDSLKLINALKASLSYKLNKIVIRTELGSVLEFSSDSKVNYISSKISLNGVSSVSIPENSFILENLRHEMDFKKDSDESYLLEFKLQPADSDRALISTFDGSVSVDEHFNPEKAYFSSTFNKSNDLNLSLENDEGTYSVSLKSSSIDLGFLSEQYLELKKFAQKNSSGDSESSSVDELDLKNLIKTLNFNLELDEIYFKTRENSIALKTNAKYRDSKLKLELDSLFNSSESDKGNLQFSLLPTDDNYKLNFQIQNLGAVIRESYNGFSKLDESLFPESIKELDLMPAIPTYLDGGDVYLDGKLSGDIKDVKLALSAKIDNCVLIKFPSIFKPILDKKDGRLPGIPFSIDFPSIEFKNNRIVAQAIGFTSAIDARIEKADIPLNNNSDVDIQGTLMGIGFEITGKKSSPLILLKENSITDLIGVEYEEDMWFPSD